MKKLTILSLLCAFLLITSCEKKEKLHLFNWAYYMPPELLKQFEKENNVKIILDVYSSNEEMYVKIKSGATGYDIIFPSGDFVSIMKKNEMLLPLDKTKLNNLQYLDPRILDKIQYDKHQEYSVPYMVSATGIAVNTKYVTDYPKDFSIYEKENLRGKMQLLDDMREVIDAALLTLGYHANSQSMEELTEAGRLVEKWKQNILKFDAESFARSFAHGEVWVAHGYAENIFLELDEQQKITTDFFIPQKGGTLSIDNMVILKSSKNQEIAYKFLNFILNPQNYAILCDYLALPSMNLKAVEYMQEEPLYSLEELLPCEIKDDVGESIELYNKIWEEIRLGG